MPTVADIKARFISKFEINEKTGCWQWRGSFFARKKYGLFYWGVVDGKEKMISAHRAAWTLFVGEPPAGTILCHKCNNPGCVNPEHMYCGTHKTNAADRDAAGTTSRGNKRYNFKRSAELIEKIKMCLSSGMTLPETRIVLGIGWTTIYRCRDQDEGLRALMAETKSGRYRKAQLRRGCRPLNRYEVANFLAEQADEETDNGYSG